MALKTFTLLDAERNLCETAWQVGPKDVGGKAQGYSIRKTTLQGGVRAGVDLIEVDNGAFKFIVVPTRGMGVWKGWLGDLEVGWKSPVRGPVHPQFVAISEPSGLGWLDGFDELVARCGLTSNGAPEFDAKTGRLAYPLHGRIANKPAHFVEVSVDDDSGEIAVTGIVDETRFHFEKLRLKSTIKTRVGEKGFRIVDEVTNLSGAPFEMQLLYHINFGQPILDAGARVVAPVKTAVPRDARAAEDIKAWDSYPAEQVNYAEQCYFFELLADAAGDTQVMLKNAHSTQAVSLRFPVKQLPCFTLWKDTAAAQDGYVTGLEPGTNFPNPRSFEKAQGRVLKLAAGETRRFEVALEVHLDASGVSAAEQAIAKLQGGAKPQIFETPQKGWVPV
jgi:galactose mutarotase-like enzyme